VKLRNCLANDRQCDVSIVWAPGQHAYICRAIVFLPLSPNPIAFFYQKVSSSFISKLNIVFSTKYHDTTFLGIA
jgi:hypothetical protein